MKRAAFLRALTGFALALPAAAWADSPCCGPITPAGQRLAAVLDQSGVDHLWQRATHVVWDTGEVDPNRPEPAPLHDTHCSVYAAAMAKRLGVYLLHPPAHGQSLLANAQAAWLAGPGAAQGWREVDFLSAQTLANQGAFVVAVYENPNPRHTGHAAVVRPSLQPLADLQATGPRLAMAGHFNALDTSTAKGFEDHRGAWLPGGTGTVRFFAHAVDWSQVPARG